MSKTTTITDEELEQRTPSGPFKIQLSTHGTSFTGWHLANSTTGTDTSARWTDMDLYRVANPQTDVRYVLFIMGYSNVYHQLGHKCSSGSRMSVALLPADAEPCWTCIRSGQVLPEDASVLLEDDIPTLYECKLPVDVVRSLLANKRGGGKQNASQPASELLHAAALIDPAFNADVLEVRL